VRIPLPLSVEWFGGGSWGVKTRERNEAHLFPFFLPFRLCLTSLLREDGLDRVAALKARLAAVKKAREEARSLKGKGKGKATTEEA